MRAIIVTISLALTATLLSAGGVAAATGPYRVKDINTSGSSRPAWLTAVGETLFFVAKGGSKGRELYKSDGTSAGTTRVKDIRPGSGGSAPEYLTAVNGLLYFSADDGTNGRELWVSDGTAGGTRMVANLAPGSAGSDPHYFTALNGLVYFVADTGVTGQDVWVTNGTTAGTRRVRDITPGNLDTWLYGFFPLGGKLFFTVYHQNLSTSTLYTTNGTKKGTKPFRDKDGDVVRGEMGALTVVGTNLFFALDGGLWRSAGKPSNTREIAHIEVCCIVGVGSTAFFESGGALWASNGTAATTRLLATLEISDMIAVGNRLFFFEPDAQPWTSDGTVAGTQPVGKQVETEGALAAIGSILYFGGYGDEETLAGTSAGASPSFVPAPTTTLWRTDGTPSGTFSVDGTYGYMGEFTPVGGSLFYSFNGGGGSPSLDFELWRYVP